MASSNIPNANVTRGRLRRKNLRMNLTIDTETAAGLRPPERPKFPFSSPIMEEVPSPENLSAASGSSGSGSEQAKPRLVGRLSGLESGTSLSKNDFERALYADLAQPMQQKEAMHWTSSNTSNKQTAKRKSGIMKKSQRPTGLQVVTNFSRNLENAAMTKRRNEDAGSGTPNRASRSLIDLNGLKTLARAREKERLKEKSDHRAVRSKGSNDAKFADQQQRNGSNYVSPNSVQTGYAPTSGLSPSDGSLMIGLRVTDEDPTTQHPPRDLGIDNMNPPPTPSILITPADKEPPWTPDSPENPRPRATSSVYSQPTPRLLQNEDVPPVPAIPAFHSMVRGHNANQILSTQNTPNLRTERPLSADTVFEDEDRKSYFTESKQKSKLSVNTTDANRHPSQGWWTYLLSPLLKRSSTISSRITGLSPEQPPSLPPLSTTSGTFKDASVKVLSEKETSHFSPDTPEDDLHRHATRDVWGSLDKETLNGYSVPSTRDVAARSVFHTGNGFVPNYELHGSAAEYYQASAHDLYSHEPYFECIGHICSMTTAKRRAELMKELEVQNGELNEKTLARGTLDKSALLALIDLLVNLKKPSVPEEETSQGTNEIANENEKDVDISDNPFLDESEKLAAMEGSNRGSTPLNGEEVKGTRELSSGPAPRSASSPNPSYHSPPPPSVASSRGFDRGPIQEAPQVMPVPRETTPIPMPMPVEQPQPQMYAPQMQSAPMHPATMAPVIMYPPMMPATAAPPSMPVEPIPSTTAHMPVPQEPLPEPVTSTGMHPVPMQQPTSTELNREPMSSTLMPTGPVETVQSTSNSMAMSRHPENPFTDEAEDLDTTTTPTPAIRRQSPAVVTTRSAPPTENVSRNIPQGYGNELPPYSASPPERNDPRNRPPPTYVAENQRSVPPGPISPAFQQTMASHGGIPLSDVSQPHGENLNTANVREPHPYGEAAVAVEALRTAEEIDARRQRQERKDARRKKMAGLLACFSIKGSSKREKRKRQRWYCCIIAFCILVIVLSVLLAITLTHNVDSTPVQSQWLNLTGYPPMPTGIMTVAGPDPAIDRSSCVAPSEMWSCALPKEQQDSNTGYPANRPNFRFEITFQNGTYSNSTVPKDPTATSTSSRRSLLLFGKRDAEPSPTPAVPRLSDQTFLGNTTDNITSPFAGEDTPFFITFLSPVDASSFNKLKRNNGDTGLSATATTTSSPSTTSSGSASSATTSTGGLADISNLIPAPDIASDGTAAAATLFPLPVAQPVRLYNRGMPTEHYGFYTYFDRRIFMKSNVSMTGDGDLKDPFSEDSNGGSTKDDASAQCTWSQTRFLVRIWTQPSNVSQISITSSSPNNTNTATATATVTSTASASTTSSSSANNFTSPGSFPYPISLTVDRHGGLATKKLIYCYGIEQGGYYNLTYPKLEDEDRSAGGTIIQQSPGYVALAEIVQEGISDNQIAPVDGGTGGCECEWRNWASVS